VGGAELKDLKDRSLTSFKKMYPARMVGQEARSR
jgi:hypothetical protein